MNLKKFTSQILRFELITRSTGSASFLCWQALRMAGGVNRKISAASARAHTRKGNRDSSFKLPSGIFKKVIAVAIVGVLAWAYQAIQPPPSKICGSPDGPPVTAPRMKLRDGRHLAYKEHGVPKDIAKNRIVFVHGFDCCRHDAAAIVDFLSSELVEEMGIYIVSFDRPGYGESDPDPNRTVKSIALDIEELADQLALGAKFYVVGFSMGGQITWSCLRYIPHRLSGAALIAPAVNFWWHGFPSNVSREGFQQQFLRDQWAYRVAHYSPWLTYWWNTQKLFPSSSVIVHSPDILSHQDKQLLARIGPTKKYEDIVRHQGEYESIHRDLIIALGSWEFSPMDLENPFPNDEGSVHIWQGDEDILVPVKPQRYIAQQLHWIHYHELPGAGHMFPYADGMADHIIKALLHGKN